MGSAIGLWPPLRSWARASLRVTVRQPWAWPWSPVPQGGVLQGSRVLLRCLPPAALVALGAGSPAGALPSGHPSPRVSPPRTAGVTGPHPDGLSPAATLPPCLPDCLSYKGPLRPVSSPPEEGTHALCPTGWGPCVSPRTPVHALPPPDFRASSPASPPGVSPFHRPAFRAANVRDPASCPPWL